VYLVGPSPLPAVLPDTLRPYRPCRLGRLDRHRAPSGYTRPHSR